MNGTALLDRTQDPFALAGRVLIALLFVPEGWSQLMDLEGTAAYIASQRVPLPMVCAVLSVVAHVGLSALIVVGWHARWAALALAVFVVVITVLFHAYWTMEGASRALNQLMFRKNCAILGGLLVLAAFGPGRFSFDVRARA